MPAVLANGYHCLVGSRGPVPQQFSLRVWGRSAQQHLFAHRLGRAPRIDAGITEEKQLSPARLVRTLNDVEGDRQIVGEKLDRKAAVAERVAALRRRHQ